MRFNPYRYIVRRLRQSLGWSEVPKIVPFTGFGSRNYAYISGMVIQELGTSKPVEGLGKWENIKAMLRRYLSNEIEKVRVNVEFCGNLQTVLTDKYGIYRCHFRDINSSDNGTWAKALISLPDHGKKRYGVPEADGEVMIIAEAPEYGVISDIDDTIMVSYATQKLQKIRLMLLNNARTRMPFPGVSAFYHALQEGTIPGHFNPIFYLSNSEWNLYDLLHEFIDFHRIPKGPLILREMSIRVLRPWKMKEVNKNHKAEILRQLFPMFPELKFILIGDSGQKDAEIYADVAREYPGRVLAIYIRDIGVPEKMAKIREISTRVVNEFKTEMILVKDTEAATRHALGKGFIREAYLQSVLSEKEKDMEKKPAETLI